MDGDDSEKIIDSDKITLQCLSPAVCLDIVLSDKVLEPSEGR